MGSLDEPLGKAIKLKARQRSDVHVLSLRDGNFDAMFFEEGLEWTNGPTSSQKVKGITWCRCWTRL